MKKLIISFFLLASIIVFFNTCNPKKERKWDTYVNYFVESYLKQYPDFASINGRHEYDGQLADYSQQGIKSRIDWLKEQKSNIKKFQSSEMTKEQIIEKEHLLSVIEEEIFFLDTLRITYKNADYYSIRLSPANYLLKDYAPLEVRMKAYLKYLHSMELTTKIIFENFKQEPNISKYQLEIAKIIFEGFADFIKNDARKGFGQVNDDSLWKEFDISTPKTIKSISNFTEWINKKIPTSSTNFAMGKERYIQMLNIENNQKMSLVEFKKIAEENLQKDLTALEKVCKKYMPHHSISECIEKLQSEKKEYNPIYTAKNQVDTLKLFLNEKNIISITDYSKLSIIETPVFMRGIIFAAMLPPFAYDKNKEGIYYLTPPDAKLSTKEKKKYLMHEKDLLFTSVHEVFPGHFLQFLIFNQNKSIIAKLFQNYATVEGWAHYCEEMMYTQGLGNYSPETEIFMLYGALLRDVRFLVSIKMHTEEMSVDDAEKYFIKYTFSNKSTAKQEALRGVIDPLYYNYTFGKIQIKNLKDEWMSINKARTLKEFHDKFLSYGGIPLTIIKKLMLEKE